MSEKIHRAFHPPAGVTEPPVTAEPPVTEPWLASPRPGESGAQVGSPPASPSAEPVQSPG